MTHSADDPKLPTGPGPDDGEKAAPEAAPGDDLETRLATAQEEARDYKDRWMRARADLENLKKRAQREKGDAIRYGAEHVVRELLPVVDDLERAVEVAREAKSADQIAQGLALVLKAFTDALARHGVERVPSAGEQFDPAHHEAVAHLESDEHEPGVVMAEHRGGYRLHDRLVRAAMVTVSKGRPTDSDLANDEDRD